MGGNPNDDIVKHNQRTVNLFWYTGGSWVGRVKGLLKLGHPRKHVDMHSQRIDYNARHTYHPLRKRTLIVSSWLACLGFRESQVANHLRTAGECQCENSQDIGIRQGLILVSIAHLHVFLLVRSPQVGGNKGSVVTSNGPFRGASCQREARHRGGTKEAPMPGRAVPNDLRSPLLRVLDQRKPLRSTTPLCKEQELGSWWGWRLCSGRSQARRGIP
jgi:hypothetical protein